jgi:hypothetical protein
VADCKRGPDTTLELGETVAKGSFCPAPAGVDEAVCVEAVPACVMELVNVLNGRYVTVSDTNDTRLSHAVTLTDGEADFVADWLIVGS